jgi:hypothetical protein
MEASWSTDYESAETKKHARTCCLCRDVMHTHRSALLAAATIIAAVCI